MSVRASMTQWLSTLKSSGARYEMVQRCAAQSCTVMASRDPRTCGTGGVNHQPNLRSFFWGTQTSTCQTTERAPTGSRVQYPCLVLDTNDTLQGRAQLVNGTKTAFIIAPKECQKKENKGFGLPGPLDSNHVCKAKRGVWVP